MFTIDPSDEAEGRAGLAALAAVEDAWNAAALRWDPASLAAIYADRALFYGGRPGHAVGRDAVRAYFESYRGVIESAVLRLVDQHVVRLGADAFVAQGIADFSFVLAGGRRSRSQLRATLVLVRADRWTILQHHFSPTPETPPLGA